MSELEFAQWCTTNNIPEPALKAIQRIRLGNPARSVVSGPRHVTGKYQSHKMGMSLQYESGVLELTTLWEYEYNDENLEIYDQPSKLQISYMRTNGKRDSFTEYPDFGALNKTGFEYISCKPHKKLLKLMQEHPERYTFDGEHWHSPPCEEEVGKLGFSYRIITEMDLDMILYSNITYLYGYEQHTVAEKSYKQILETVQNEPGITLFLLCQRFNPDDINKMIQNGDLYVDLHTYRLSDPDFVPVFPDEITGKTLDMLDHSFKPTAYQISPAKLEVNSKIVWSGRTWTIANVGSTRLTLIDPNGDDLVLLTKNQIQQLLGKGIMNGTTLDESEIPEDAKKIILHASPKAKKEANYRATQVERYIAGDKSVVLQVPDRTLRDWVKKYKTAQQTYGIGYLGLLSKHGYKGRRESRLDNSLITKMEEYITKHFENSTQETRKSVYNRLCEECKQEGLKPPSLKTFLKAIEKRDRYLQTLHRQGRRAAYQTESPLDSEVFLPHATRPFERAHLDHTPLDIFVVDSRTGLVLGKPWLSVMIDDYSRRVLGSYLTFEAPSAISVLMVLKNCIKRYQRLPQYIVVDNGKEFHSTAFETFLAVYGVHLMHRPPAEARYGTRIERYFGTINTQMLKNLRGNSQATKTPRQMTKSVDPRRQAIWTLRALREKLEEYFFDIYDRSQHSSLGFSPRKLFERRLAITGNRPFEMISYTPIIDILTLPPTPKGSLKIHRAGIKFQNRYFWNQVLKEPGVMGLTVPVVYDPSNAGLVYAFVKNQWHKCICKQFEYHGRSLKEIEIVTEEYRKRYRLGSNQSIDSSKLARFISEIKEQDEYKLQVAQDRALKDCYSEEKSDWSAQDNSNTTHVIPGTDDNSPEPKYTPDSNVTSTAVLRKPKRKERF